MAVADAATLVFTLHGRLLRVCCVHADHHFEGLAAAGRRLCAKGAVSKQMRRKLETLDLVAAWLRHATSPLCRELEAQLQHQLAAGQAAQADAKQAVQVKADVNVQETLKAEDQAKAQEAVKAEVFNVQAAVAKLTCSECNF